MTEDEILAMLDIESARKQEAVRELLREKGRLDLLAEFDAKIEAIRLGTEGARNCWHSISPAQRRVLDAMAGRHLLRAHWSVKRYDAIGSPHAIGNICGRPTARALCAHELIAPDGGALDPERKFVLTERGRFVLKHGRPPA